MWLDISREGAKTRRNESSLPFKGRAGVGMGLSGIRGQRSGIRKTISPQRNA